MAMTTCKECGKQVSTGAKTCPHCGTSAPAKKKAKGGIGKWLLIVFAIGLVAMILPKQDKATSPAIAPTTAKVEPPQREARNPDNAPSTDLCFSTGKALATVYLQNFSQMADAGVMASKTMRQGCEQTAKEQGTGEACIRSCEIGFKQEARHVLK